MNASVATSSAGQLIAAGARPTTAPPASRAVTTYSWAGDIAGRATFSLPVDPGGTARA